MLKILFFSFVFVAVFGLPTVNAVAANADESSVEARALTLTSAPLLVLDAAHGGSVQGVRVKDASEAALVLDLSLKTEQFLIAQGLRVLQTRPSAAAVSLSARIASANQAGAAAFVSFHLNHSFSEGSRGIRLFVAPSAGPAGSGAPLKWKFSQRDAAPKSMKLARGLARNLVEAARRRRAVQHLPMAIFRGLALPSVVLELGFVSHAADVESLSGQTAILSYAEAVARGLVSYLNRSWHELADLENNKKNLQGMQAP